MNTWNDWQKLVMTAATAKDSHPSGQCMKDIRITVKAHLAQVKKRKNVGPHDCLMNLWNQGLINALRLESKCAAPMGGFVERVTKAVEVTESALRKSPKLWRALRALHTP
eukprot:TRINITY_DN9082_c0_g1_i1.p3 TRINITY_DN9082_c0_g1~~TRINITY_DN9082_c0_g1_i1.p3  ORF type:complete len:110 (-),score=21.80 TRINITY_DN9082_c0_g1_i1:535-864(-)